MAVFYWATDTSQFLIQPQLTHWRFRYRGSRESWKQNIEMNQIAYDIYHLYNRSANDESAFESNQYNIEFGVTNSTGPLNFTIFNTEPYDSSDVFDTGDSFDLSTSGSVSALIDGSQDLIKRIQKLQFKVNMLESNGWNNDNN